MQRYGVVSANAMKLLGSVVLSLMRVACNFESANLNGASSSVVAEAEHEVRDALKAAELAAQKIFFVACRLL